MDYFWPRLQSHLNSPLCTSLPFSLGLAAARRPLLLLKPEPCFSVLYSPGTHTGPCWARSQACDVHTTLLQTDEWCQVKPCMHPGRVPEQGPARLAPQHLRQRQPHRALTNEPVQWAASSTRANHALPVFWNTPLHLRAQKGPGQRPGGPARLCRARQRCARLQACCLPSPY